MIFRKFAYELFTKKTRMKLSDKCRLCLIKSSINSDEIFFPIDSSFEKKFSEITKLQFVKPQSAEELKRFPDKVCMQCVSELEHHYNYRNSLIEKQKRLNILLGKEEEIQKVLEQAEHEQYLDTEALQSEDDDGLEETIDSHDINTVASPGKSYEEESEEMKEPETDKINSEYEAEYTVESYDGYEQIEEHEEDIYEEQETLTSVSEVIVDSLDEENQNHAIDDKEENYDIEVESDDYLCIIKNEGASDTEGEYDVVYEDDITVQEKPIYNKRKYTKQSKDSPNQFKCWIRNCGSTFAFRSTMKKHMHQTHSIVCDKSTCFICGDRYDNYADFLAHVKCHTRKTECDVCKLTFVNEEKLEGHKNKFHKNNDGERKFKCHVSKRIS